LFLLAFLPAGNFGAKAARGPLGPSRRLNSERESGRYRMAETTGSVSEANSTQSAVKRIRPTPNEIKASFVELVEV
jgi:hypothetical protein